MADPQLKGKQPGECPFCDAEPLHLNNHIRPTDGNGHGVAGQYPDEWDPDKRELVEIEEQGDGTIGADDIDPDPESDEQGDEPREITIETGDMEARVYECPECDTVVAYGNTECENGHTQNWF